MAIIKQAKNIRIELNRSSTLRAKSIVEVTGIKRLEAYDGDITLLSNKQIKTKGNGS